MQLIYLSFIDADGRAQSYDLTEGALKCKDAERFLYGLECALFGAESLFSGSSHLIALCGEDKCEAIRDFEKNTLNVTVNGRSLSEDEAEKTMAKLAVFKREQWKESVIADGEDFIDAVQQNTDGFLAKFFAYLGIDEEELNNRYQEYDNRLALLNAQIDALGELCEGNETIILHLDNLKTQEMRLQQRLDSLREAVLNVNNEEKEDAATVSAEECTAALSDSENARLLVDRILEYREIASGMRRLESALDECYARLEKEQNALSLLGTFMRNTMDERERVTAETERIKADFVALCRRAENTVLGKEESANTDDVDANSGIPSIATRGNEVQNNDIVTNARAIYGAIKEEFIRISARREKGLSASFRNAVRKSGIFDAVLSEKTLQKDSLTALQVGMIQENAVLTREIESCEQALNPLTHEDGDEDLKETRRQRYFRSKIICDMLNGDIAAANAKIVTNLDARKTYSEDADALQKARLALKEYVKRCEERREKINEKRIGIKAKLAYCKGVDEMEYGSVCPVCQGRVTDKSELSAENAKLQTALIKYNDELTVNGSILLEYREKLEKIDARLGRLNERDSLSQSYIESLSGSILQKKKKIADFLKLCNAKTTEELDKIVEAALTIDKDGLMAVQSGEAVVNLLRSQTDFLTERKHANEKYLAALSVEIEKVNVQIIELQTVIETEIAPFMDGKSVSESADILSEAERSEEEERKVLFSCCKTMQETADAVLSNVEKDKIQIIRLLAEAAQSLLSSTIADETRSENFALIENFVETQKAKIEDLSHRLTTMRTEKSLLCQKLQALRDFLEGAEDVDDAVLDELRERILDEETTNAYRKIISVSTENSAETQLSQEENTDLHNQKPPVDEANIVACNEEQSDYASVGCAVSNNVRFMTDKSNEFYDETNKSVPSDNMDDGNADCSETADVSAETSEKLAEVCVIDADTSAMAESTATADSNADTSTMAEMTDTADTCAKSKYDVAMIESIDVVPENETDTEREETAVNTVAVLSIEEGDVISDRAVLDVDEGTQALNAPVSEEVRADVDGKMASDRFDGESANTNPENNENSLDADIECSESELQASLSEIASEIRALQEKITVIRAAESAISRKQQAKNTVLMHIHNVQALMNREGSIVFVQAADALLSAFDARLRVKASGHEIIVYRNDKPLTNGDEETASFVRIAYDYALNQLLRSASGADTMRVITLQSGGGIVKRCALQLSSAQNITVLYS